MATATDKNVEKIVKQLKSACDAYYNGDSPVMSDADFDKLKDELIELDPNNPFLATVGAAPSDDDEKLSKATHQIPMGSLKKINAKGGEGEYRTWLSSVRQVAGSNPKIALTWKLDGSSIEVIYRKGVFSQAITRGDGVIGDDITHTIKNAQGLPKKLSSPIDISVRAEAIFRLADWNKFLSKEGANPRNVATGTCRRTDERNSEHLHCVAFNVLGGKDWKSLSEKIEWLKSNGFETVHFKSVDVDDVPKHIDGTLAQRSNLIYEIDGLVVALDDCSYQEKLGEHNGLPYWARAWKFPNMGGFSKLLDVSWDVGTRGTINPVAHIEPVPVGGVTITNVTLHNMDEIERLGIQIGDEIEVVRAGDVIPKIIRVVKKGNNRTVITCSKCPACGGKITQSGPFFRCVDAENCSGVLNKRIMKYIKKRDIMYLGDSALDKLIAAKAVSSVKDLYFLTVSTMVKAGVGEGMARKILEEIRKSMKVSLADLIGSLSIDLLGRSEAENIVSNGIVTLAMWKNLDESRLIKLGGYQTVSAGRICAGLRQNWSVIEELAKILEVEEGKIAPKIVNTSGVLKGASFCFTGAMEKPRKELQKLVSDNGGVPWDSVGKGLTYLVTSDPTSTSAKANKARSMGVQMITEEAFLKMIGM